MSQMDFGAAGGVAVEGEDLDPVREGEMEWALT